MTTAFIYRDLDVMADWLQLLAARVALIHDESGRRAAIGAHRRA